MHTLRDCNNSVLLILLRRLLCDARGYGASVGIPWSCSNAQFPSFVDPLHPCGRGCDEIKCLSRRVLGALCVAVMHVPAMTCELSLAWHANVIALTQGVPVDYFAIVAHGQVPGGLLLLILVRKQAALTCGSCSSNLEAGVLVLHMLLNTKDSPAALPQQVQRSLCVVITRIASDLSNVLSTLNHHASQNGSL